MDADLASGVAKGGSAALESVPLVVRHGRVELTSRALAPDDRRERNGRTVVLTVCRDRQDCALVAQDRLGDPRAGDADAELAGVVAFDDRDVREADLALDLVAKRSQ